MSATYDLARWITLVEVNEPSRPPGREGHAQLLNHIQRRALAAITEDDRTRSASTRYGVGAGNLASLVFIRPVPPDVGPDVFLLAANNPADAQLIVDALNAYTPPGR